MPSKKNKSISETSRDVIEILYEMSEITWNYAVKQVQEEFSLSLNLLKAFRNMLKKIFVV